MQIAQEHDSGQRGDYLNLVEFVDSLDPGQQEDVLQGTSESEGLIVRLDLSVANAAVVYGGFTALLEELSFPEQSIALRRNRLREVVWRDRRLELKQEIEYVVRLDDDLYVIEYEPLGVQAYARSLHDAERDFHEEFVVLWDEFGLAPDEDLAPGGMRLKRRLRDLILQATPGDEEH